MNKRNRKEDSDDLCCQGSREQNEISTCEDTIKAILAGKPVGCALKYFKSHYLDLNNHLTKQRGLLDQYAEEEPVEKELVRGWIARNDARAYIIFGAPAVRLRPEIMSL